LFSRDRKFRKFGTSRSTFALKILCFSALILICIHDYVPERVDRLNGRSFTQNLTAYLFTSSAQEKVDGPVVRAPKKSDQNLISRAPPFFGKHIKPLVPAAFAVVCTHSSFKEGSRQAGGRSLEQLLNLYHNIIKIMLYQPHLWDNGMKKKRPDYLFRNKHKSQRAFIQHANLRTFIERQITIYTIDCKTTGWPGLRTMGAFV
jgi:hypothetical protein